MAKVIRIDLRHPEWEGDDPPRIVYLPADLPDDEWDDIQDHFEGLEYSLDFSQPMELPVVSTVAEMKKQFK